MLDWKDNLKIQVIWADTCVHICHYSLPNQLIFYHKNHGIVQISCTILMATKQYTSNYKE